MKLILAFAIAVLGMTGAARADTYMTRWLNNSTCNYGLTQSKDFHIGAYLDANKIYDGGATAWRVDSVGVSTVQLVRPGESGSCNGPSAIEIDKVEVVSDSDKKSVGDCPGLDHGPFYIRLSKGSGAPTNHYFCVRWGQVGYINTTLTSGGNVSFENVVGAYNPVKE